MPRLTWDDLGKHFYETGTKQGVLYPMNTNGGYNTGVVWNGLTAVSESPSGAEETPLYADDRKYLSLRSAEEFGATIEAYTYPDEWAICDGSMALGAGVTVGQQTRRGFGLSYVTTLGNDVQGNDYGYKIHIIYNAMASPSEKSYATINDSPEAITFSWEVTTNPIDIVLNGVKLKPSAILTIDSTKIAPEALKQIEDILYGSETASARLPLPAEIIEIISSAEPQATYTEVDSTETGYASKNPSDEGWYVRSGSGGSYSYTLTEDTTPQDGTTYYIKSE